MIHAPNPPLYKTSGRISLTLKSQDLRHSHIHLCSLELLKTTNALRGLSTLSSGGAGLHPSHCEHCPMNCERTLVSRVEDNARHPCSPSLAPLLPADLETELWKWSCLPSSFWLGGLRRAGTSQQLPIKASGLTLAGSKRQVLLRFSFPPWTKWLPPSVFSQHPLAQVLPHYRNAQDRYTQPSPLIHMSCPFPRKGDCLWSSMIWLPQIQQYTSLALWLSWPLMPLMALSPVQALLCPSFPCWSNGGLPNLCHGGTWKESSKCSQWHSSPPCHSTGFHDRTMWPCQPWLFPSLQTDKGLLLH